MRNLFILLALFLAHSAQANELSAPTISQLQGMVIVNGQHGFTRATQGLQLQAGDEIRTGYAGKVYIDFPDHSRVKLGVKSRFIIQDWDIHEGIFTSSLRILQGAFRYTASALQSSLKARQTTVKTNTAVLGVRGTDFWGRAERNQTFFLLLEGSVQVAPSFAEEITYNKAGYAINIQTNHIASPQPLTAENIAPLAAETEITP